jgi:hypothetical protein
MTLPNSLGFIIPRLTIRDGTEIERVIAHLPLQRVLSFLGYGIDDVCNDWLAKSRVIGYYKLYREVERSCEVTDLERQWNPTGAIK